MAREKSEKGTAAPPTRSSMPIPCSSRGHPDGGCASLPSTGLHSRLRLRFQLPLTSRGQLPDQDDHTMHHHHKVEKGRMTTKTSPPTSSHKFNQFAVFDVVDKVADIHAVLPLAVPRKLDRLLVRRVDKTTERMWESLWLLAVAVARVAARGATARSRAPRSAPGGWHNGVASENANGNENAATATGGEICETVSEKETHVVMAPFVLLALPVIATPTTTSASNCENRPGGKIVRHG